MSKITVKSKLPKGFRRAGIAFTREGVDLDTTKLKKGQLEAIEAEPNLIVIHHGESAADRKAREKAEAEQAAADKAAAEKAAAEQAAAEKAAASKGASK